MAIKIYNTLTRRKETLAPLKPGQISMYTCGPTVYWFAHLGNFATFTREDFIRRYLEYRGYRVKQIMNFTDVGHLTDDDANTETGEDKMVKAARREQKSPAAIAQFYIDAFFRDAKKLNLKPAAKYPRATDEIAGIIELVKRLLAQNYAYEVNGNVFFNIAKFKNYGQLSGQTPDKISTGLRLEPHPDKKNPGDFALWLKAPPKHIMKWDSPWGKGYPGWHIECSAMALRYLGDTIDIHIGGEDHLFPHHENEIAQSEAATGKPFSQYWMHMKFILIDGEKMSKSKNNILTLNDLEAKGFAPLVFRAWLFSGYYRSQANFTWEGLEATRDKLNRLIALQDRLRKISSSAPGSPTVAKILTQAQDSFETAMDDDFNSPPALDAIFKMTKEMNSLCDQNLVSKIDAQKTLELLEKFDTVTGFLDYKPLPKAIATEEIEKLITARKQARSRGDFAAADKIRDQLQQQGIEIKDFQSKTSWKVK
jgi:cysteinyl-tRNA synthetase